MHATMEDNGHVIHSERIPSSGDSDGHNIYEVNKTFNLGPSGIVPNNPSRIIKFSLDVWDSDWPGDDDHLGEYEYTLEHGERVGDPRQLDRALSTAARSTTSTRSRGRSRRSSTKRG